MLTRNIVNPGFSSQSSTTCAHRLGWCKKLWCSDSLTRACLYHVKSLSSSRFPLFEMLSFRTSRHKDIYYLSTIQIRVTLKLPSRSHYLSISYDSPSEFNLLAGQPYQPLKACGRANLRTRLHPSSHSSHNHIYFQVVIVCVEQAVACSEPFSMFARGCVDKIGSCFKTSGGAISDRLTISNHSMSQNSRQVHPEYATVVL